MKMSEAFSIIAMIVLLYLLWCLAVMPPPSTVFPAELQNSPVQTKMIDANIDFGEVVFNEIKSGCGMCHKIKEEDNRRAPLLKGFSKRMSFEDLSGWLLKHLYEPPRIFMFSGENGPSEAELSGLTFYLFTL